MSRQPLRVGEGRRTDAAQALRFRFDGHELEGLAGDTLASALLANGIRCVARSFKYHRPRGIFSAGPEEPCALVQVGRGAEATPNSRVTQVELFDGLEAFSQNRWPSLGFDLLAVNDRLSKLFSAGFYNKTFKWPRRGWPLYERLLRRTAGHGRAPGEAPMGTARQTHDFCDVLIVGAGPAGIAAAETLAGSGLRVLLVDENPAPGGWLIRERAGIAGLDGVDWVNAALGRIAAGGNVRFLERTTAFGYYDHNLVALVRRAAEPNQASTLIRVRAQRVLLATGAIERPLVFVGNDLPGVMLAGAARAYLHQFGVAAGRRVVVCTGNDSAYRTALDLHDSGVEIAAVADLRDDPGETIRAAVAARGIGLYTGARIRAQGRSVLAGVQLTHAGSGGLLDIACDALCVSGGWTPALHLHSQSGGAVVYDEALDSFVPGDPRQATGCAGSVNGIGSLDAVLADGQRVAADLAASLGRDRPVVAPPGAELLLDRNATGIGHADCERARAAGLDRGGKAFIDLQNDVTVNDVRQAHRESYLSVEHLKRYTTLGMGTDQGKTSNLNGLKLLAGLREEPVPTVGQTTFRPPYTPVPLEVLAGTRRGALLHRSRRSPLHDRHEAAGAVFDFNGLWLRPACYLAAGEDRRAAIDREVMAVRTAVGLTDISTLGTFELRGPDSLRFLERVYANRLSSLRPGSVRYGLMLRDDGMILDDGTVARLADDHYVLTTSTGHAEHVHQHLEYGLNVAWPNLDVNLADVTEQWAGIAVAGPLSRQLLGKVIDEGTTLLAALPYLGACRARLVTGQEPIPVRLLRLSYSGELAYEIHLPAHRAGDAWDLLMRRGALFGVQAYGMDAMDVLRIEKGFIVVGAEADGRVTADDLGMGRLVAGDREYVGRHGLDRPGLSAEGRLQLVGLEALDTSQPIAEGAQLTATAQDRGHGVSLGHVSSAGYSAYFERHVALGLLRGGRGRIGETVWCFDAARGRPPFEVRVIAPCVYDPSGARMKA